MKKNTIWLATLILTALLVTSCGVEPTPGGPPTAPPVWLSQAQPLVDRVIDDLGRQAQVDAADIAVVLVEEVEWPNSCLGCPQKEEVCLQVITPGYRILLQAGDEQHEYRTDLNDVVRYCPSKWGDAQTVVDQAVQDLALKLQVDMGDIVVVMVEKKDWPDSCLGCPQKDEMCLEVITPGYRIILQVGAQQYEYRSTETGAVRHCPAELSEAQPLVELAVEDLSLVSKVAMTDIVVVLVEEVDWPNSCLGCPQEEAACLEVITPGYRILLQADEEQYEYRTAGGVPLVLCMDDNQTGDIGLNMLIDKARTDLAGRLNVAEQEIAVASVDKVTWPDSSLGCPQPGHGYLMVITPGYRILLEAQGQQYAYHTDMGSHVVWCEK